MMDPYTERLLEQTRLRRERLNEKLGKTPDPAPRKRTLEENTSHNIIQPNLIDDDSPKRHCIREVENAVHPDTPAISGVKSRLNLLTQARQQWSDPGQENGTDEAPSTMLQQTYEQRTDHSPQLGNRKNRFAQLAQHINTWEDDLSHFTIQKEEEKKPRWQPPKPEPEKFQTQQSSLPSSSVESRDRHPSVPNPKKTTPPSPQKTAAPPAPPPPPPVPIVVPVVSRSPVAKWSPKKSAAPPPPTDSAVKLSTTTVQLCQPSGSLVTENPKHKVKQAEELSPVNAPNLEDTVPSEEKMAKPVSERISTWKMKTDTPIKTPKPEDPTLQPVSARMASWEQKVSQTPTTERVVSTKVLITPKLTCTPAQQIGSAVKSSAPPSTKGFLIQPPQQPELSDSDPVTRSVSDRMASWQQKDAMANPPREEEPTAYSVLARMSAWEHASSSNQVSYVKKVDPGLSPQRSPTKESLKTISTPSKPKAAAAPSESFKDSIVERAHQIRTRQSPVHTLPPRPPNQTKGLGSQSPMAGTSPVRGATTPTKQGLGSPTKIGSATKMLQERLMEQTVNSKTNQLADKIRQERMEEVNALKNRWQNGILKEDTSSETEAAKMEEHPHHMSVPHRNPAAAGTPQDKREAIKAKARADFDRKLAAMGFDISDQGAAYVFSKNGTANGENEVTRGEEKVSDSIPPMEQPHMASVAATNDQRTQKQTESKPTSSIYRLVSKKSDASEKPFVRQESLKKVRFECHASSTEESESGTDRQTSDELDTTEDFDPKSEESVTETTQDSDLSSSQDSFESESDGMEPQHYDHEPVHKHPQQHQQYEMYDDGEDVSLSAFVPPSVRRQSVLPHGPNDDRQSITSEDSIECAPYRGSHVSTTNLRSLAQSHTTNQDNASRQTNEKVRQRQQSVNQSSDESDDEGHSGEVDAFLDEAMDETLCQKSKDNQPVAAPRKRISHMMATTVGELPVRGNSSSHTGNMASSAHPGNLAYSVSMYRSQRGVTTTVQTTVNIARSPHPKATIETTVKLPQYKQYESDASQSQMRITRNCHYVGEEDIAEEDIEMPMELPPEQQRKTIRERIQELQELVNQEQSVIMQTSNALNQCCSDSSAFAGSSEQVECHRLLLVSCQKRQAYLTEVQRLKETSRLDPPGHGPKGSFTISDIRLPLKKEFVQKIGTASVISVTIEISKRVVQSLCKANFVATFKPSCMALLTDNIVHYFIILVRNGPQVIVTQMLSTHDPMMRGSLDFPNLIKIHGITGDFKVILEIYSMSISREIKKDKKRKTPRKQSRHGITMESPGGPNAVRSTSFTLITTVPLTMKSLDKNSFTLERITYLSPLHGTIYMKLKCMMEQNVEERGFLTMFEDVSGLGAWHRRWCVLTGNKLAFWKYPDDENKKDPIGYIDLKRCITEKVGLVARDICARPNTLEMITVRPPRKGEKDTLITKTYNTLTTMKHMLSADTKEERIVWCNKINRALANLRTWHADAMRPIKKVE